MSARLRLPLLAALAGMAGCATTGIHVAHVTKERRTIEGAPWNLGMTQFKITITRHLVGCGPAIKANIEVLASPTVVLDEQQRYVLSSSGLFSTSDITANLSASGVSTGLNAQSSDQTATVISNVIGTVAQVAIGVAAAGQGQGPQNALPPEACKKDVAAAVAELHPTKGPGKVPLKEKIDEEIGKLATATARVSMLTAQAKADPALRSQLVQALTDQHGLQEKLEEDQRQFKKDLDLTTDVQVVTWPRTSGDFRKDEPYLPDRGVHERWADSTVDSPTFLGRLGVRFALYRANPAAGTWDAPPSPAAVDDGSGVPIRLARAGRLLACTEPDGASESSSGICPPSLRMDASLPKNQAAFDAVVLQLGQLYVVPARGGTFRSETAVIAVDSSGLPTTIETAEKASVAATATGVAKDAAAQLAALPGQVRASQLARTQAEASQLNAEASLATAEANATVQGQTSSLAAQTALVNAQTALATARTNAGLPLQTAGVSAQTALLNAQAALATAKASAQNVDQTSALAAQTTLLNAQAAQVNAAAALARAQAVAP